MKKPIVIDVLNTSARFVIKFDGYDIHAKIKNFKATIEKIPPFADRLSVITIDFQKLSSPPKKKRAKNKTK